MSAHELLNTLHRLGVRVWIEGDRLEIAAPKALLTDDLRAAIQGHRRDMIAILAGQQGPVSVDGISDVDLLAAVRRVGADLMINYRGRLAVRDADLVPADLREPIRQRKDALVRILTAEAACGDRAPGLPLLPPDYAIPPEWQPAPPFTPEEQATYDGTLREMAEVLTDADLVEFVASYGATLYLEHGTLRARDGQRVPAPIREVVRARQEGLVAVLEA
jgi:hypothetical protein